MTYLIIAAIVGAGVVTGLLFAFSNFVMRALAELSHDDGVYAMQRINEKIINPLFLLFFLGTPLLCVVIAVNSVVHWGSSQSLLLLSGAACYLIGPFGITLLFNVPLNNRLSEIQPPDSNQMWTEYQIRWQRWNHVRTYIGMFAIALLAAGIAAR